ncbi:MAG: lysine--tRNA ligase [Alphaproteobacteria bacterium]|nr:lysine--tRNA ligase [Alphaproteobacteria bacterium]MCB9930412.1 lysine--tRNA ligase [Alphaproteobacteria bacterium]
MSDIRSAALTARAWPFEEARKVVKRLGGSVPAKGYALFETGYGPSGLPHIGTFGEVARTSMVRRAFRELSDIPTELFAFSDDMDGLRKVPGNVPNQEMLAQHLGKPLTQVPDPFGTHESFGHHNNARLRAFLDSFGFAYTFQSATECYTSGRFDAALLQVLRHYDAVINVILPTLGPERRATYSPFLPICPRTGIVLQEPIVAHDADAGTVTYRDPDNGRLQEVPVTGGHCKLQWKADWAMRWYALEVDYEMSGKDLIDSVNLSSKICRILGGRPPEGFTYELFLDDRGEKISKTKGNGLAVEEWLKYAPPESLSQFMFQKPRAAKKLYFDVIPKAMDEYRTWIEKYPGQDEAQRLENPVWHIHAGQPPAPEVDLSFGILLNLASVANAEDKSVLWGFISRYRPAATPETAPLLDRMAGYAVQYYQDFVKPAKQYRAPSEAERAALVDLRAALAAAPADADAEALQNIVYEIGKRHGFENLRDWFKALYETLLGQSQGPRMGSFIALYGRDETMALIDRAMAGHAGQ